MSEKDLETKAKTSRQIQAENMKLKLQHIVESLAREKPLDQIRIQEICKLAGVSLGNFYQYFSCKEEALTYSYHFIDLEWRKLKFEEISNPLERMHTIIETHITSMANGGLCFLSQLYLSQLRFYDSYFFTQDRYLVSSIRTAIEECQKDGTITTKYSAQEIAEKLLSFSRGLTYNFCIKHQKNEQEWLKTAIADSKEYISLFEIK